MCCSNRAEIRPVLNEICVRPIDRDNPNEVTYAAMMHMRFTVPSGASLCRTFGLNGEQILKLEADVNQLKGESDVK